jgi:hypothetical protein
VANNTYPGSKNSDSVITVVVNKIKGGDLGLKIYFSTHFHLKALSKRLKNLPTSPNNPQKPP